MEVPITPEEYVAARLFSAEREIKNQTARSCKICGADTQNEFCEECTGTILTMRKAIDERAEQILEKKQKEKQREEFSNEELKVLLCLVNIALEEYEKHDELQNMCDMFESIIEKIQQEMGRRE